MTETEKEKMAYYRHKKEVLERELSPVAEALGLRIAYYRTSQGSELITIGDCELINVTGSSTEAVKRRFIEKISAMVADKRLDWIYEGETV